VEPRFAVAMAGKGYAKGSRSKVEISHDRNFLLSMKASKNGDSKEPAPLIAWRCLPREELPEDVQPMRPKAGTEDRTTIKLKNVPVEASRTSLCEELAGQGFGYSIDFLYLPVDSATGNHMGYAFVNVRTKDAFRDFKKAFHEVPVKRCLPGLDSDSAEFLEVCIAEVQGRDANMHHLCTASNQLKWQFKEEWQPLFLNDYGAKIEMEDWQGPDSEPGTVRRMSAMCSPAIGPAASPNFKPSSPPPGLEKSDPLRAEAKPFSPGMSAEAKEFSPGTGAEASGSPAMNAEAKVFTPLPSPNLRAEAEAFVPLEAPMEELTL